jgi:hypothetical protein
VTFTFRDATFCSSTIFLDELRRQSADQSAVALDEMNVSHVYSRLTHPLIFIGGHPRYNFNFNIQGGSDKSGILQIFFKNYTAQLKIIRFHQNKNT